MLTGGRGEGEVEKEKMGKVIHRPRLEAFSKGFNTRGGEKITEAKRTQPTERGVLFEAHNQGKLTTQWVLP